MFEEWNASEWVPNQLDTFAYNTDQFLTYRWTYLFDTIYEGQMKTFIRKFPANLAQSLSFVRNQINKTLADGIYAPESRSGYPRPE